jgi:GH18 family chitinase
MGRRGRHTYRIAFAVTCLIVVMTVVWMRFDRRNRLDSSQVGSLLANPQFAGSSNATARPSQNVNNWIMGYYVAWQTGLYPPSHIDFTAITHIALGHWLTAANGTVQPSAMDELGPAIVLAAHRSARKAVMMLGGSDDTNFASAANSTNRSNLVNSILNKIDSMSLDGVDLDWELNIDRTDFVALAQALRRSRPNLVITAPIDPSLGGSNTLAAALAPYCDQLNMMTYGGGGAYPGWLSWYFSALAGDGLDHPSSVNLFVSRWLKAGVPAVKIGIGVGFYGKGWTAPVTGPRQFTSTASVLISDLPYGASSASGGGVLSWFYNQPGSTYAYDAGLPQQPSISIRNGISPPGWSGRPITWVTYEDEASVAAKAAYVKANGLGGLILWTLNQGATDPATGRNPLLDSAKRALLNEGPAPMPLLGMRTASGTVTGLPATLTQVAVAWRGEGCSFDQKFYSDPSSGWPSEYYIEGSPNGSTWTELRHVIGNSYNGGQFVFDVSGHKYTRLRMRVVSIVGRHAGPVEFDVYDAAMGSADSYLFLGDSLLCGRSSLADSAGEAFRRGIHEQRPKHYPMLSGGSIGSLLISSMLNTLQYGIPTIRKWLQDFPAAKYVVLSFGTNEANSNVPAATYCSNMQELVQEVIAAGKTPIIPTIVASPSPNVRANAPAMNGCLAKLRSNYPSIIAGPDMWTLSYIHSVNDGWFSDNGHPSLTTGDPAVRNAWTDAMVQAIYPR